MSDNAVPMPDEMHSPPDRKESTGTSGRTRLIWRVAMLAAVVAGIAAAWYLFGDRLSLSRLAEHETQFRAFQQQHPVLVFVVAFSVYVVITGLSLPGASAMTLLTGWLFGFWRAVILVSFASTSGATVAFLISRYLLRDPIQSRFGDRLKGFNAALEREGAFYLFTLRLIPVVPFFVINVVMGLTRIRVWTFWWVSQAGMLAGTAVFVYAGSTVPNLQSLAEKGTRGILSPQLLIAFVLLGLFPLVAKRVMQRLRPQSVGPPDSGAPESAQAPQTRSSQQPPTDMHHA